jgi:DNA-binding NarL/FixJ family response regulator
MTRPRVLLADDHGLTLGGIIACLAATYEIVGTAVSGLELIAAANRLKPDVIVLDISMPVLNGIDAARELRDQLPRTKLVFLTMHASPAYLEAALNTGATGYVLKSAANEELLLAIESVLQNRLYVSPGISRRNLEHFQDPAQAAASLRLTARERAVLQLVAEGKAAKEIGFLLEISVKTVAFHRENIKQKLSLSSTAELTRYAIEQGLL